MENTVAVINEAKAQLALVAAAIDGEINEHESIEYEVAEAALNSIRAAHESLSVAVSQLTNTMAVAA